MPNGPVVEALLERRFRVHAINPKQLDRFRDRFTVAGAKDDRRDAHVLADSLRTDRHAFRQVSVDDPVIVELREWVADRRRPAAGTQSSGQPRARAAVALLPADAQASSPLRRGMVSGSVEPGADAGEDGAAAREHDRTDPQGAPYSTMASC
jgi:transposase